MINKETVAATMGIADLVREVCKLQTQLDHAIREREGYRQRVDELTKERDEAIKVIAYCSKVWCIKPECKCFLCEFLAKIKERV